MDQCEEHQTADYFVWVAANDRDGGSHFSEPKAGYDWTIRTRDWKVHESGGGSYGDLIVNDYHARAVLVAAKKAALEIPPGSIVHFFSDISFIYNLLNEDREARRQKDYRKSKGKGKLGDPLAYQEEWRSLDEALDAQRLTVSAGKPNTDRSQYQLYRTKTGADAHTKNRGLGPGEWGT